MCSLGTEAVRARCSCRLNERPPLGEVVTRRVRTVAPFARIYFARAPFRRVLVQRKVGEVWDVHVEFSRLQLRAMLYYNSPCVTRPELRWWRRGARAGSDSSAGHTCRPARSPTGRAARLAGKRTPCTTRGTAGTGRTKRNGGFHGGLAIQSGNRDDPGRRRSHVANRRVDAQRHVRREQASGRRRAQHQSRRERDAHLSDRRHFQL